MKITQEELERRLKNPANLVNKIKRGNDENNRNNAGRLPEIPNAPKSLRIIAGVCAKIDNGNIAARALDITPGQARYAARTEKLSEKRVQEVALTRLMDALGLLTPVSMLNEKPKDISSIAANLSRVHKNLAPASAVPDNQVNITIYSPKQREIKDYEVIEVACG
jgi:hypothetical protein